MKYINKSLIIEKVKIQDLAKKFGTPAYCYSYKELKETPSIWTLKKKLKFKLSSLKKFNEIY